MEKNDLKQELESLQKKAAEYLAGWQRAKADYLNLKRDVAKQQLEVVQIANMVLLGQILPILDNFQLALSHIPKDQREADWVKGFFHIQKELTGFFKNLGIVEIKTVGENFNPEFHEAMSYEAKEGFMPNVIFEEISPGYTLQGKVIKPARVKVAK